MEPKRCAAIAIHFSKAAIEITKWYHFLTRAPDRTTIVNFKSWKLTSNIPMSSLENSSSAHKSQERWKKWKTSSENGDQSLHSRLPQWGTQLNIVLYDSATNVLHFHANTKSPTAFHSFCILRVYNTNSYKRLRLTKRKWSWSIHHLPELQFSPFRMYDSLLKIGRSKLTKTSHIESYSEITFVDFLHLERSLRPDRG